ncbi:MFS transporter [Actinacidiphila acidipaludis]|uniref:MFS transporter n=1 Tax=Actinacidiphila acidipaludis TaxID=2873382 RepID=A0ABS7QAP0_9ACTN|nr:MFS transporter [Streptomyces acidipaludis]MBY8880038.1 MFS transporter [Streptomyces acidipaludis]
MYLADRAAPAREESGAGGRRGRAPAIPAVVLALGAVSLVTDVSSEMVTAVLPLYLVAGLGLSPLGFGTLDGVYNGVSALVQLTGGHLADRVRNHKLVAGIGYGLSAVCKPLLLVAHSLGPLGAVLALERTGKGLRTSPRDALISLSTPPEHRGRAFGVHRAMDTTGAVLGPFTAFLILRAATDGYDAVFGVSACVAVLGVLILVLFVPGDGRTPVGRDGTPGERPVARRPGDEAVAGERTALDAAAGGTRGGTDVTEGDRPAGPPAVDLRTALALLRLPRLRALAACAVLLGLTTVSDAFVYLLLQRRAGIGEQYFPLLPLGTAAVFLLLAVPFGVLADRIGRRVVFLAGHAGLLAAYGLLLWAPSAAALPFLVLGLHGVFYASTDGVLPAAVADVVPERLRGSGLALVGTGQALARFCCSLAFGAAWTVWGDVPALLGSAVGLTLCAAVAGAVLRPSPAAR